MPRDALLKSFRSACCVGALLLPALASAQELLPNLEPFPATDVHLADGGSTLRFATTTWNRGLGPIELLGGEIVSADSQNVYQRIYSADGSSRQELVGTFEYHGGTHNHFHLEDYARYTLMPINAPGATPRDGQKVSFCLLDYAKINTRLTNAPKKAVYTTCNPDIQGISVGWSDTYRSSLDGQSVDFTGNPSGDYLLTIEANPDGRLFESNYSDNIACVLLRIDVTSSSVQVLDNTCNAMYGPVSITSISPGWVAAGGSTAVTISGSGFQNGIDVHFSGGSGKVPTLSNVIVVDSTTITATVSVATGGSPSDPVWNLHVGNAVLADALTVIR